MSPIHATCWICGGAASTGEHMTKRSDLRSVFGTATQSTPLYVHNAARQNFHVGSLDAKVLKSPGRICAYCNNARTQPHDLSWERLSQALRNRTTAVAPGSLLRTTRIFRYDTRHEMLNVHLYFVKLFGCHIAGSNIPIDISGFRNAIMNGRPHPCVYLKFGCGRKFGGMPLIGMSDMWLAPAPPCGFSTFATWFYDIERVSINVMFGADGEKRIGLSGAWHPRQGTTRLTMANLWYIDPERADASER